MQVGKVWNFVGSTAGVLVLYIYPSAFYLRLRYLSDRKNAQTPQYMTIPTPHRAYAMLNTVIAATILGIGVVLLIVENYQAIAALIDSSGTRSSQCSATENGTTPGGMCHVMTCNNNLTYNHTHQGFGDVF